jgi:hypothetical protein
MHAAAQTRQHFEGVEYEFCESNVVCRGVLVRVCAILE